MIVYILMNAQSGSLNPLDALTYKEQLMAFRTVKAANSYRQSLEDVGLDTKDLIPQKVSIKLQVED